MSRKEDFIEAGIQYRMEHGKPMCIAGSNLINVIFRKEQDGWHTYTQYGVDLPIDTTIEFGEHIAKTVDMLNGKEVPNE